MEALIVSVACVYLGIGIVTSGFAEERHGLDWDFDDNDRVWISAVVIFWPIYLVGVLTWPVARWLWAFGQKLGGK